MRPHPVPNRRKEDDGSVLVPHEDARRGRDLPTTDSPAAARRRLRFALRSARENAGLTQSDVAARLEWSVSKVNRIENGEVTISPTDLRALMGLIGVTDRKIIDSLAGY